MNSTSNKKEHTDSDIRERVVHFFVYRYAKQRYVSEFKEEVIRMMQEEGVAHLESWLSMSSETHSNADSRIELRVDILMVKHER